MPRKSKELSAAEVRRLTETGRYPVGGVPGLMLQVTATGARSWILRYSSGEVRTSQSGKAFTARRDLGLGGYPEVPLKDARDRAREIKDGLRRGIDPIEEKRALKAARLAALAKNISFEEAAREYHSTKLADELKNAKHKKQWLSSLERYAFPTIGSLPVSAIELAHIERSLAPIWKDKTETATRVRQRIETVLDWCTVRGLRDGENPARWKGNLEQLLPKPTSIRKTNHFRAVPWDSIPAFFKNLTEREGMATLALQFLILTAARSGEVRYASWDEIDLKKRVWTVPGDRIKAGKTHRVPLSDPAVTLLADLPRFAESQYVFPAPRNGALSDMSLTAVLRRMSVDATVHGFRSSFKDWARSMTSYADEVSELALAHVNSDATRAAYARDELLPQRARMMNDWATYCVAGKAPTAEVTSIGEKSA